MLGGDHGREQRDVVARNLQLGTVENHRAVDVAAESILVRNPKSPLDDGGDALVIVGRSEDQRTGQFFRQVVNVRAVGDGARSQGGAAGNAADGELRAGVDADGGIGVHRERAGVRVEPADVPQGPGVVIVEEVTVAADRDRFQVEVGRQFEGGPDIDDGVGERRAERVRVVRLEDAFVDEGLPAIGVRTGEHEGSLAGLGDVEVAADHADDVERGVGDAVLDVLRAVDFELGVAVQGDGSGPERVAADGADRTGIGLREVEEQLEHAAAISAGRERVQRLVHHQIFHLHVGHARAELEPVEAVVHGGVHAHVGAHVQLAVAGIDHERPGGLRGADLRLRKAHTRDVGPRLTGIERPEDGRPILMLRVLGRRVHRVAIAAIDRHMRPTRSGTAAEVRSDRTGSALLHFLHVHFRVGTGRHDQRLGRVRGRGEPQEDLSTNRGCHNTRDGGCGCSERCVDVHRRDGGRTDNDGGRRDARHR